MLDLLTVERLTPLVGHTFTLRAADGEIEAELETVSPGAPAAESTRTPFSIVFLGPVAPALQQGIHEIEHPALGAVAIFLVPIARDGDGSRYEAVFS